MIIGMDMPSMEISLMVQNCWTSQYLNVKTIIWSPGKTTMFLIAGTNMGMTVMGNTKIVIFMNLTSMVFVLMADIRLLIIKSQIIMPYISIQEEKLNSTQLNSADPCSYVMMMAMTILDTTTYMTYQNLY